MLGFLCPQLCLFMVLKRVMKIFPKFLESSWLFYKRKLTMWFVCNSMSNHPEDVMLTSHIFKNTFIISRCNCDKKILNISTLNYIWFLRYWLFWFFLFLISWLLLLMVYTWVFWYKKFKKTLKSSKVAHMKNFSTIFTGPANIALLGWY